jgi:hypothetical protein
MAAARTQAKLSPKVLELVAADRLGRPPAGRLTAAHVDQLTSVARRTQSFDVQVSPAHALRALASGAQPRVAIPILDAVLSDSKAPAEDRIAAARGLATAGTAPAEGALLSHLRIRNTRVQQAVLAAVGTIGSAEAAEPLACVALPRDPASRRQLAFARALVAHREGLDGPFLTEVRAIERRAGPPTDMVTINFRVRTADATTSAVVHRLSGTTYGIAIAERGITVECGPAEWMVFLNKSIGQPADRLATLFDRPWIAAIATQATPGREALITRLVILTRPVGRAAHVDVVRADGEIVYTGSAERGGGGVEFAITDVERPATAPLTLAGRLTATRVELDTAVIFASRVDVRKTTPAEP